MRINALATASPDAALGSVFVFTHGHSAFVEYRQHFGHAFLHERVPALGWRMELQSKLEFSTYLANSDRVIKNFAKYI